MLKKIILKLLGVTETSEETLAALAAETKRADEAQATAAKLRAEKAALQGKLDAAQAAMAACTERIDKILAIATGVE